VARAAGLLNLDLDIVRYFDLGNEATKRRSLFGGRLRCLNRVEM
jgi:hypothetical protein